MIHRQPGRLGECGGNKDGGQVAIPSFALFFFSFFFGGNEKTSEGGCDC